MIIIMASAAIANAHIENWGKSAFLQKGDESNFGGDSPDDCLKNSNVPYFACW